MMSDPTVVSPALIIIGGAALVPFLPHLLRNIYMLALPIVAFGFFVVMPQGEFGLVNYLGVELVTLRVDLWSRIFVYIFLLATLLSVIFALHVRDTMQQVAGLVYAGGAIGAVLAGDFLTLFMFWEVTAIASVFLVWATRTRASYRSGIRYIIFQLISGVLLLMGALAIYVDSGSLRFEQVELDGVGGWLIFIAFGIKCAFPLLHNWLQDAYPNATATGVVFLSAFTTKLAVYALARGFAGEEILIYIGAAMAVIPLFYAVLEDDLRRVLAYALNNQLGFMVIGVGVGTELALNGTAAHAFCHILYKSLLFMSMGAVLYRTGTARASSLGGLYKSMPWTTGFCIVGAASMAFPLFGGFVSKSLIISAASEQGYIWTWAILMFAAAGVFLNAGLKVPYFAFFSCDRGIRCEEAPKNMLAAMAIASAFCIGIGLYPPALYSLVPYAIDYEPYTGAHVVTQLQLLAFTALAFAILVRHKLYPTERPAVIIDTDVVYRRWLPAAIGEINAVFQAMRSASTRQTLATIESIRVTSRGLFAGAGPLARPTSTSTMIIVVVMTLGIGLALYY